MLPRPIIFVLLLIVSYISVSILARQFPKIFSNIRKAIIGGIIPSETTVTTTLSTLRYFADQKGMKFGSYVEKWVLDTDPMYAAIVKSQFNEIVIQNELRWNRVEPQQGVYDTSVLAEADYMVKFAEDNGMIVRVNPVVWGGPYADTNPSWLNAPRSRDEMIQILRDYIQHTVGHYKGRIAEWDIVNEPIDRGGGGLEDNIWLQNIGPDYIDIAFQLAHEADPQARLYLNEFGAEGLGYKSASVYNLVTQLLSRNVPIHGVGLEMHVTPDGHPGGYPVPDPQYVKANIKRLQALGLDVHISEMDVSITDSEFQSQAQIYKDMLNVALETNSKSFTMWGFTDAHSWIMVFHGNTGWPCIYDTQYNPKPAYYALVDAFGGTIDPTANFGYVTIEVNDLNMGHVSPSGTVMVLKGSNLSVTANPNSGYGFEFWTTPTQTVTDNPILLTDIRGAFTITANFRTATTTSSTTTTTTTSTTITSSTTTTSTTSSTTTTTIPPQPKFTSTKFNTTNTTSGHNITLSFNNDLNENATVLFIVTNEQGLVVDYFNKTVSKGLGSISKLVNCASLGVGNYTVSWEAYLESDKKLLNIKAWSKPNEWKKVSCK